jgi:hypothetical protein
MPKLQMISLRLERGEELVLERGECLSDHGGWEHGRMADAVRDNKHTRSETQTIDRAWLMIGAGTARAQAREGV